MQEEKENMVDIDTSGPGADVELPEEKLENEIETKEDSSSAPQEAEAEKVEASDEKQETKQEEKPEAKKDELQDYSKDVQRRISFANAIRLLFLSSCISYCFFFLTFCFSPFFG